jgi:MFS family permease
MTAAFHRAAVDRDAGRLDASHLALLAGTFAVTFDFFVVNLALPAIAAELATGAALTQWVVTSFGLVYGAGLLVGSRVGERFGATRVFRAGFVLFLAGSIACALAGSAGVLVAARCVQGAGAALLSPQVMSLLGRLVPDALRLRGFAGYGVALGLGSGLGQVVGGLLVDPEALGLGWRACFLVNLPVGLLALAASRTSTAHGVAGAAPRIDRGGALILVAGLVALLAPVIEGRRLGWPAWLALSALAGIALLAGFAARQLRRARAGRPLLVDPRALRNRDLRRAIATVLLFYCGNASFFYVVSMYLQQGRGLAPLAAALVFTVMVAGFLATSFPSRRIGARLGDATLPTGSVLGAAGHASLALLVPADVGLGALVPSLLLTGAGIGIAMGPLIARSIAAAEPGFTALAAGLVGSAQWIGNAAGVAVVGTLYLGIAASGEPGASARAAASCHWVFAALSVIVAFASTRWREWSRQA